MSSERTNTFRPVWTVSRIATVALLFCLVATLSARQNESENKLTDETKNRKVELPRVSEEDQVKLWVEGVPWFKSMEERGEIRSEQNDPNEHAAYCYTLVHAHKTPLELLTKHALKNVPFANLIEETPRKLYRFELVHFEGRLARIDRVPQVPQKVKASLPELKEFYQGWLFPKDDRNEQPICILFTELPKGMEVKELCNYWVGFEGYYFKLLEYRSEEKNEKGANIWRLSPVLIGHAPRFMPSPYGGGLTFGGTFVPMVVGTILLIAGVAFGLTYWFRKGDREVRRHIATPKSNPFNDETNSVQPGTGWTDFETKDNY